MTDLEALNREVADRVMGWKWYRREKVWVDANKDQRLYMRPFATDIAAAFEVVEKVCGEHGRDFCCGFESGDWRAQFVQFDTEPSNACGKSLPEAICRAALQVVGAEI